MGIRPRVDIGVGRAPMPSTVSTLRGLYYGGAMRQGVRSPSADTLRDAPDRIQRLLDRLRGADEEDREAAADDLERWARDGLSDAEVAALLDAACTQFPPRRFEILDTRADLVRALGFHPREG